MAHSQPLLVQARLDALEREVLLLLKDLKILKDKYIAQNKQQHIEREEQVSITEQVQLQNSEINITEHSLWYKKQLSHIQKLERRLQEQRARAENVPGTSDVDRSVSSIQRLWNVSHTKETQDLVPEDRHIQSLEFHCSELCQWLAGEKHIIELMSQLGEVRFQRLHLEKRLAELEVQMLKQECKSSQDTSSVLLETLQKEDAELKRGLAAEQEQTNVLRDQTSTLTSKLDQLEGEKADLLQQLAAEKQQTENAIAERNRQDVLVNNQSNLVVKLQQQVAQLEGKIKKREKELCFVTGKGNADDMIKCEALLQAAWTGNVKEMKLQLESGADIHSRNYVAQTPLHLAAGNDHTDLCALLLDHGAVVDPRDLWQNTPLHFAACNGHLDTVNLLLDRGAKSKARNRDGRTPRDWAILCKHNSIVECFDKKENMNEDGDKVTYDKEIIANENHENSKSIEESRTANKKLNT